MNSDNLRSQRGNAMVYILVALALFGVLTAVLVRQGQQSDSESLTEEMAQFESAQLLAYAQASQRAVDQMLMAGASPDDLEFDMPNSSSYDVSPYIYKIYHPEGGGLVYKQGTSTLFTTTTDPAAGWYMGLFNNVEWTRTGQTDIILTAYGIREPICRAINEKILGTPTIPAYDANKMKQTLVDDEYHTGTNEEFNVSDCGDCDGMAMLCVSNGGVFSFYSIIEGR